MSEDLEIVEGKYKLFVKAVAASKLVWGLKNKKGWANANSSDSEEVDVVPFWSDRAFAKASAKDDWRDFTATQILLPEFLEAWCIPMANDGILAGINWDANMFGKEVEALRLALDILNQLKSLQSAIKFSGYSSIDEFTTEIQDAFESDKD